MQLLTSLTVSICVKAVQGCYGQVEGAGPDLSFIGLQHCCLGSIQPHHLVSDDAKTRYITEARAS